MRFYAKNQNKIQHINVPCNSWGARCFASGVDEAEVKLNPPKTEFLLIISKSIYKNRCPTISICGIFIQPSEVAKMIGVLLENRITMNWHGVARYISPICITWGKFSGFSRSPPLNSWFIHSLLQNCNAAFCGLPSSMEDGRGSRILMPWLLQDQQPPEHVLLWISLAINRPANKI